MVKLFVKLSSITLVDEQIKVAFQADSSYLACVP